MLENYKLTNVDAFFLTFIAAWASTNAELWNHTDIAILLIIGILCYSTVLAQIRYYIYGSEEEKLTSYNAVVGAIILVGIVAYLCGGKGDFLKGKDVTIIISTCIIWVLHLFGMYTCDQYAYKKIKINK